MKDGATLVNAVRGAIVDSTGLLEALRSRRIRAALDVTDLEPLPADHALGTAPGLMSTPHPAGTTRAWLDRVCRLGNGFDIAAHLQYASDGSTTSGAQFSAAGVTG